MSSICNPSRVYINGYYRRNTDPAFDFIVSLPSQVLNPKTMCINSATVPLHCYNFGNSECVLYFQMQVSGFTSLKVYSINIPTNVLYNSIENFAIGKNSGTNIPLYTNTNLQALLTNFCTATFGAGIVSGLAVTIGNYDSTIQPQGDGILSINAGTSAGGTFINKINIVGIIDKEQNWNSYISKLRSKSFGILQRYSTSNIMDKLQHSNLYSHGFNATDKNNSDVHRV